MIQSLHGVVTEVSLPRSQEPAIWLSPEGSEYSLSSHPVSLGCN